jgi:hypothetical protein
MIIFLHTYRVNNWKEVLFEQLEEVNNNIINITIDNPIKLNIQYDDSDLKTLISIWEYSQNNNDTVLFLCNHGITHQGKYKMAGDSWRKWIMEGVVGNWKEYVSYLDEYDVVGDNFKEDKFYREIWPDRFSKYNKQIYSRHFSTCSWWANTNYLKKLDNPFEYSHCRYDMRMYHETWICSGKGKFKEVRKDHLVEPYTYWNNGKE